MPTAPAHHHHHQLSFSVPVASHSCMDHRGDGRHVRRNRPRWFIFTRRDLPPDNLLTNLDIAWLNSLHIGGREQDNRRIVMIFFPDLNLERLDQLHLLPEVHVRWL